MQADKDEKKHATVEQLVDFLAKSVRDTFERTRRGVQGSLLAHLLRNEFPDLDYTALGLTKLGDLVRIAEQRGLVIRNKDVAHLELSPAAPAANANPMSRYRGPVDGDLLFVLPEIWRAVVLVGAQSRSFFNLTTSSITEIPTDSPKLSAAASDPTMVEIERVSQEDQMQWLKEFLISRDKADQAADEERLRRLLKGEIYSLGSALAQDWKSLRSRKVVEHVRRWATTHSVDPAIVLVPPRRAAHRAGPTSVEVPAPVTSAPSQATEAAVRRAVVAIVHDMTLAELETLSLPLRHVLRHFAVK